MPSCRKDLMFDSRIGEEAEGERRIIGSRREVELEVVDGDGTLGFLGSDRPAEGMGTTMLLLPPGLTPGGYWFRDERLRPRKTSAVFRTWEKSCAR
jgi:hypothetical protein